MTEIFETIVTCVFMSVVVIGSCVWCAYMDSKESGKSLKEELFDEED